MPLEEALLRARVRRLTRRARPRPRTPRPRRTTDPREVTPKRTAQLLVGAFAAALVVGTVLLVLPAARTGPGGATPLEAFFTAASAICVTGLVVVDTPVYWTPFGQAVILALIQLGGFGVMSFATVLGILLSRRLGLSARITSATETKSPGYGDMRGVLLRILATTVVIEAAVAAALGLRFGLGYGYEPGRALWHGVFHAVSAFNNAGFALYSLSITDFAADPWITLPLMVAVVLGGLGFPVLQQLRREWRRPLRWSMNTRVVLMATAVLLGAGTVFLCAVEWSNPATLGPMRTDEKLLAGLFQSVIARTAGFNSIDVTAMHPVSWLGLDLLMLIGGGPAGTAGGLKVTTVAVLGFVAWAEITGQGAVTVLGKRLSRSVQRQATTVVVLALGAVVTATTVLMLLHEDLGLDRILFEVVSAFATVGLSTGITAQLSPAAQLVLVALMFLGRLGPITVATALAARTRRTLYELPKERPLIG
ncbi:TrkH family potassium uptake protein [Kocuria sp. LUK]|uniref:TrkH family potassium uptake protein n=1 Tax=Kocuria sp. LUK TaxID=2897828 RepID=UPI001E54F70C|nr:potassium transporter TrkG [Kocuria sp. LUK]MCD1144023.1 TrkH family potassium uptake protein [Kocuria sp. LUK]